MKDHSLRVFPDPILRKETRTIAVFDKDFLLFVDELKKLMIEYDGVGLAAPQIGESLKVAVILYEDTYYVLINPTIVEKEDEQRDQEGCLSFPGVFEDITRPYRVVVEAQDETGAPRRIEAEGFLARAMCHEIDHLNGKLMIDHLSPMKRELIKKRLTKLKKEGNEDS
ncbi:peptide deformylase [Dethiosulfovibrio salsuginis]|uniref:Peptide deformylase n=1 Tax=Dethiosulfovibrio salsuginis TaxID=561720 RepID=A0A1X7I267_9BACT|nr:peptide deformylase [Dethiosulfovibrio salsuginis]SMG08435.1 peptide deformylase [Dethiosulfovibrio salsuginis]